MISMKHANRHSAVFLGIAPEQRSDLCRAADCAGQLLPSRSWNGRCFLKNAGQGTGPRFADQVAGGCSMSTTSMSTVNAAAGPAWTQPAVNNQASVALPDGSFSSQVAAIWNQSPSSPGAAGSASSASLNDRPVASSAPASRTPGRAETDSTSGREAAQVKPPASRSQTMQPASARESRHAVETRGRGTPDAGTGAADADGGIEDDASTADAQQPDARTATGAPSKSLHKLSQATGARPDDGAAAPALQPELPAGALVPPAHLPDIATEPTDHGLGNGGVTASDRKDPTDDSKQQTTTDAAHGCAS